MARVYKWFSEMVSSLSWFFHWPPIFFIQPPPPRISHEATIAHLYRSNAHQGAVSPTLETLNYIILFFWSYWQLIYCYLYFASFSIIFENISDVISFSARLMTDPIPTNLEWKGNPKFIQVLMCSFIKTLANFSLLDHIKVITNSCSWSNVFVIQFAN